MSKICKKPIQIPKGELGKKLDNFIIISFADGQVRVGTKDEAYGKEKMAIWGLTRALIQNMIKGTNEGFEKSLEFEGVGYKANVKGNDLELSLGYSHPVSVKAPAGVSFKVEKGVIKVIGIDKELVGHVSAEIK